MIGGMERTGIDSGMEWNERYFDLGTGNYSYQFPFHF